MKTNTCSIQERSAQSITHYRPAVNPHTVDNKANGRSEVPHDDPDAYHSDKDELDEDYPDVAVQHAEVEDLSPDKCAPPDASCVGDKTAVDGAANDRADPPLYNPTEAARIAELLSTGLLRPEYILLFGSLAGGTPHSEARAYDLLLVFREAPPYQWQEAKRYLRLRFPVRQREIAYVNLYLTTLDHVQTFRTPFLHLAHDEGEVLYCRDRYRFRRPRRACDYAAAFNDAYRYYDTFGEMGSQYLERAQQELAETVNLRMAAVNTAQAAVCFYHTLYYVYHGEEFPTADPVVQHERMRTLSTGLMLALDDDRLTANFTLPSLRTYMLRAQSQLRFETDPQTIERHMDRVARMERIVRGLCEMRMELYEERAQ